VEGALALPTAVTRRHLTLLIALIAAALVIAGVSAPTAAGVPTRVALAPGDDEGGTPTLREQLDAASRGYLDARNKLDNSRKRQAQLAAVLTKLEAERTGRSATVEELASRAYRLGRLGPISALLDSSSTDAFVDRATSLTALASRENREVNALTESRDNVVRAKAAIDAEVKAQEKQLAMMAARKKQAERALAAVSSGSSGGFSGGTSTATPAPRNPDGSWPAESCSLNDPTTSGCVTPRNLHAYQQARANGFTRYTSCYRAGGSGEHPKGRACDYAAERGGFGGVATGDARTYGNNLAAFFVRNASRLGVLYVIWYRQIWLPSSGWRSYSGGGTPSSDHTNHVHLSVY
jgi:hypothetical protein